jgi:hypothetical protein
MGFELVGSWSQLTPGMARTRKTSARSDSRSEPPLCSARTSVRATDRVGLLSLAKDLACHGRQLRLGRHPETCVPSEGREVGLA